MKIVRDLFDSVKPNFEKGGKFEKLFPFFDAFETFAFVPNHTTHSGSHLRDSIDLKRTMIMVVLALIPALLFGIWNTGYQHHLAVGMPDASLMDNILYGAMKVLPLVIVSYTVGLGVEFTFCIIKKHTINEGYLVSGMLIPLCLPVDVPLWMVAVATIFAVVIGKEVFGGTGMNILNVALTARAFLFFAYPTKMSGDVVWIGDMNQAVDGYSGSTNLALAIEGGPTGIASFMDSFLGFIPGSVGETSTLAILLGAALLLYTGIASWKIMASGVVGALAMGTIFNVFAVNPLMEVPAYHHLVLGGFAFGLVFMATDPVTAAQTEVGKYIYGFFIGFFSIMIRVFNPAYPEGVMLAILFMNVMAPLIDHYVVEANINRRLKRVKVAA